MYETAYMWEGMSHDFLLSAVLLDGTDGGEALFVFPGAVR